MPIDPKLIVGRKNILRPNYHHLESRHNNIATDLCKWVTTVSLKNEADWKYSAYSTHIIGDNDGKWIVLVYRTLKSKLWVLHGRSIWCILCYAKSLNSWTIILLFEVSIVPYFYYFFVYINIFINFYSNRFRLSYCWMVLFNFDFHRTASLQYLKILVFLPRIIRD